MKKADFLAKATIAVMVIIALSCVVVAAYRHQRAKDLTEKVYIVYTDEESKPYAVLTNPTIEKAPPVHLTEAERDTVARIVAGKAGSVPVSTQLVVANVIRNCYQDCGSLDKAIKLYQLGTYGEPTDDTYDVVDAVFERSELCVDDDVLFFNDLNHHSDFHDGLELVCSFHGINFYRGK